LEKIKAYGICLYKKNQDSIKVLLCKSMNSQERWGFLKGVALASEKPEETAVREFQEESSIRVEQKYLRNFFIQKNDLKNIGIYLVNANDIENLERFFDKGILFKKYLSVENSDVRFFDIKHLPLIKKKQKHLTNEIITHLEKT